MHYALTHVTIYILMNFKKTWWFFLIIFLLACGSVLFWQFLQEKKSLAHFYLHCQGANATIYLDNQKIGMAPIKDHPLQAGFHQLELVTDHYTFTTPLSFAPNTATVVDWQANTTINTSSGLIYELTPDPTTPNGSLQVISLPDHALFVIDDSPTPLIAPYQTSDLTSGSHQLTFSLPGFHDLVVPLTLTPNFKLKLTVKLAQK